MSTSSDIGSNKRPKLDNGGTKANVLMVGTGEYTTGYVGGQAADSDKGAGVVALTMFDLRRRGKVSRVGMCGVNVSYRLSELQLLMLMAEQRDKCLQWIPGARNCARASTVKARMISGLHLAES
jgi:hypothetical protein